MFSKIQDVPTARLALLAFRKANRYPIDPVWEASVMSMEPDEEQVLAAVI